MILIGISGKIGSGKSTLMAMLKKYLIDFMPEEAIEEKNFADKLKKVCYELTGYYGYTQEEKNIFLEDYNMTVGLFLQKVGTDILRNTFDKDIWVKSTLSSISKTSKVVIIGDVRFPNEVEIIQRKKGIVIRLEGDPAKVNEESTRDKTHSSEIALDNYTGFDFVFNNIGTIEDLDAFAKAIATKIHDSLIPVNFKNGNDLTRTECQCYRCKQIQ